jgi:DNA polymerase III delta' subunit
MTSVCQVDETLHRCYAEVWDRYTVESATARAAHAVCISGDDAGSARNMAYAFVYRALCEAIKGSSVACGSCRSCSQLKQGQHPDFYSMGLNDKNVITIDQVRDLIVFTQKTAHGLNGSKAIVIDGAESMNQSAANALLKVLEEPPLGCYFYLVSAAPHRCLPTILSRCQHLRLHTPAKASVLAWLSERSGQTEAYCQRLLAHYTNRPSLALAYARDEALLSPDQLMQDIGRCFQANAAVIDVAAVWAKQAPLFLLDALLELCAGVIRGHLKGSDRFVVLHDKISSDCALCAYRSLIAVKAVFVNGVGLNLTMYLESFLLGLLSNTWPDDD